MEDRTTAGHSTRKQTLPPGSPYRDRPDAGEADAPLEGDVDRADVVAWIACAVVGAGAFIERGHVGGAVSLALLAVVAIPWGARHSLQAAWERVAARLRRGAKGRR
jgi:hypothetical protein